MLKKSDVNMKKRSIARFRDGVKLIATAEPTPFDSARCAEIMKSGKFGDDISGRMTDGELAYAMSVWDAMPDGRTSLMSAVFAILNNQIED